jgi:protocatechuate 3,4-dioxygenase beta subunit
MAHALVIRRDGFATLVYALDDDVAERERFELGDFTLAPGAAIDGRVVDAADAPIAGVAVDLSGFNDDWSRFRTSGDKEPPTSISVYGSRSACPTRADGTFHFANLSAGSFQLIGSNNMYSGSAKAALTLASGELHAGVELRLVPGLAITGRVVDSDGHALPNCIAAARPEPPLTGFGSREVDSADGHFELGGLAPGNYTLYVDYHGAKFHDTGKVFLQARREHVAAGTTDLVVELAEGVRLRGHVKDHDGKPVDRAVVNLIVASAEPISRWSMADGLFEFVVAPDTPATVEVRLLPSDATERDLETVKKSPPLAVARDVVAEDGEITIELPPAKR